MTWEDLDWNALDRLRETFLSGAGRNEPYWTSRGDLAGYDFTFGERIGWKWDAVLRELKLRGWRPPGGTVLDWGCGSGIASRRVLRSFGVENFSRLILHDHSALAIDFAAFEARKAFPGLTVDRATVTDLRSSDPIGLLVISHVLNELSKIGRAELNDLIARAQAVIWVEPGTSEVAGGLVRIRESLRATFRIVAPCTHQAACGLLTPANASHWCHHFAAPPPEIFVDSNWAKFARRAGIDLRSLPYSFLVLEHTESPATARDTTGVARVLGDARLYKGYAKLLGCEAEGVSELTLQKRDDPVFFKSLKRSPELPLYRWTRTGEKISQIELLTI